MGVTLVGNIYLVEAFSQVLLFRLFGLEVSDETATLCGSHLLQDARKGHECSYELFIVAAFIHLCLGGKDADTSLALAPQAVGLAQFSIVEVDLPDV